MRINPKASWVLGYRGFANARKGRWDHAVADFDEEAKRVPDRKPNLLTAKAMHPGPGRPLRPGRYDLREAIKADEGHLRGVLSCPWLLPRSLAGRLRGSHQKPESRGAPGLASQRLSSTAGSSTRGWASRTEPWPTSRR